MDEIRSTKSADLAKELREYGESESNAPYLPPGVALDAADLLDGFADFIAQVERLGYLYDENQRLKAALGTAQARVAEVEAENRRLDPNWDVLHEDLAALLRALGLFDGARPESPHAVMLEAIAEVGQAKALAAAALGEHRCYWSHSAANMVPSVVSCACGAQFEAAGDFVWELWRQHVREVATSSAREVPDAD